MGDFVEGCACFASFFAKQALDYGGKKGCRDNFVMPTLSTTVIRGSYVAATTTMVMTTTILPPVRCFLLVDYNNR